MLDVRKWNIVSPEEEGLHEVVTPEKTDCKEIRFYRLNLQPGRKYVLDSRELEMNVALVNGNAIVNSHGINENMNKLDSFYITSKTRVTIEALSNTVFFIPAAPYEGIGAAFFRKFQKDLPLGDIHQVHGKGRGRREVFFTLNPEIPASRLICGYTWGEYGSWTSWPPHQHEKYLEEIYCYFDMPEPQFGVHFSYFDAGKAAEGTAHLIRSGNIVLAPKGYHPTVASPGTRNTYLWALASLNHESRRYDLAKPDPFYENT